MSATPEVVGFMCGYALLPLVASAVSGFTFTYVLAQHRRSPVNRAYLLLSGWLTAWMFVSFLLWASVVDDLHAQLLCLYPVAWVPVGLLLLDFSYALAGRRRDLVYYIFLSVGSGFLVLVLTANLFAGARELLDWELNLGSGIPWLLATAFGVFCPAVYSWFATYSECRRSSKPVLGRQVVHILAGIMLALAIGFSFDVILMNALEVSEYAPSGVFSTIALSVCVFAAVRRYRFLSPGVEDVAIEMFAAINEGVVIIDSIGRVIQCNDAAAALIHAAPAEDSNGEMPALFDGYSAEQEYSDRETAVETASGTRYVSISQHAIREGARDCCRILLLRDMTADRKAQDELRRHQGHLKKLVQERTQELVSANELLEAEIWERRSREAELRHQEVLLRAASKATSSLLTTETTSTAIRKAVQVLGEAVGVDRICILEERVDAGEPQVNEVFEWHRGFGDRDGRDPQGFSLSWIEPSIADWSTTLRLGQVVEVSSSDFDGEPGRIAKREGIRSIMIVPAQVGDDVWGYVCFVDCFGKKRWTDGEKWVLMTVAAGIAGAIKQRRVEDACREGQDRLRGIVENALDLICELGEDGRYVYVSPSHMTTMGYIPEDLLGRDFFEFVHPEERDGARKEFRLALLSRSSIRLEIRYRHPSGTWRRLETNGKPYQSVTGEIRAVLVSRDITRRKQMEDELLKSNKLESIGILAGGIAHDFNNILGMLWANISLAKLMAGDHPTVAEHLAETEKALTRARDMTKQLLTFARGGEPVKKTVSLTDLVRESARFSLRGTGIALQIAEGDDLWPVDVDEGQINQVFSNIFINAHQAMPEGGTITVSVENARVTPDRDTPLLAGRYVVASVRDTGVGIDASIVGRIFDPYFTTKESGTGLGLATAYSIVRKHSGHISVCSRPGNGAVFKIYLPASASGRELASGQFEGLPRGTGRVLVMDDEEALRRAAVQMLREAGYDAEAACDGRSAIRLYSQALQEGNPYDVVIMDLTVPGGLGGRETISRLREIDSDVKAIASSGYSDDPIMSDFRRFGFVAVLEKPYAAGELAESLRVCLKTETRGGGSDLDGSEQVKGRDAALSTRE